MKFRIYGMILSVFFALGLVFSFGGGVYADHGDGTGIAAGDVDPTVKEDVEAFLGHIIEYYTQVNTVNAGDPEALTRELVIGGRSIREEGVYKNEARKMYSISINESRILTNHAGHPGLFGYQLDPSAQNSAVTNTIQTLIDNSDVGSRNCQTYGDEGRFACAEKVDSSLGELTIIAGLHHDADDGTFTLPDCSGFDLETSAEDVYSNQSDANLEAYVKGVIDVIQKQVKASTDAQLAEFLKVPANAAKIAELQDPTSETAKEFASGILQRVYSKAACFGDGDFKHENIYAFIMDADPAASTVLFNGNNFDLNGANLRLNDDQLPGDDKSISGLFSRELGDAANGDSAYVNYHWDDPTTVEDDVPNFFDEGKVPGTSCKRSYIEVADINKLLPDTPVEVPEALYIFGSGIYPGDESCTSGDDMPGDDMPGDDMPGDDMPGDDMPGDDMPGDDMPGDDMPTSVSDGGCTIAGADNMSQSALLNLFLVASVLFPVVFLRRRA